MILTGNAIDLAAKTYDDISECAVVHVKTALEKDSARVDAQSIALLHMVVEHGAAKVVRRGNRVHIACKVKVDVLHREYLSVAAACSAALDAEYGTERGFSQGNDCLLSDFSHSLSQTCGGSGFTFTCRGRVDSGNENQFAVGICADACAELVRKLCLVFSVKLEFILGNSNLCRHFLDRQKCRLLSNFNIRQHKMHLRKVYFILLYQNRETILFLFANLACK